MATFRKRNGNWQAQVRCAGQSPVSRTFPRKSDAMGWARQVEAGIIPVDDISPASPASILADLLVRYRDEVSCTKRGGDIEAIRINRMLAHPFSQVPLTEISSVILTRYRADRLKQVQPETVRRELTLLHHLFEVAVTSGVLPSTGTRCRRSKNRNRQQLATGGWKPVSSTG